MYAAVFPLIAARALTHPFDYVVPAALRQRVARGSLVAVPLGQRTTLAVVLGLSERTSHTGRVLPIASVVDLPPVRGDLLDIAERISRHYLAPLGACLGLVTPPEAALRLEKTLTLTEAGRAALAAGDGATAGLAEIAAGDRPARAASVSALRRRGWVEVGYRLRLTRDRDRDVLVTRGPAAASRLGVRQRAAVELVEGGRTLPTSRLRERSGLSAAGLRRLVAREVLVEAGAAPVRHLAGESPAHATEPVPTLLPEQEAALATILSAVGRGSEVLLHGVTGSGKTEVYLRAAETVLRSGHSVLYLVPEIGLTGQTVARVRARFPDVELAVLHSGLSAGERLGAYRDLACGRVRLAIGARSAIFAPLHDLGLIVVDEEHDPSYKQDNDPRYDARTVARWRAAASGAALVCGSATPSVEAFARVALHADLPRRVDGSAPPRIELVDMRDVHGLLSPDLARALTGCVEAGEKAILFLNRRGYAAQLACRHCGHAWVCGACDVPLALFVRGRRLRCRLCGAAQPAPDACPACGSADLERLGHGTEAVEQETRRLLPGVEILRLDSDIASSFARLRGVLDRFAAPGGRVLVGTQMIAKGHHFPEVTLVGVVDADLTLRFPDFRAEERTFAMLVQVAGRSGRGERPGRVLVQTLDPRARPIAMAASGEHERFYEEEVARRAELSYPPSATLIAVEVSSAAMRAAAGGAQAVAVRLRAALRAGEQLLGPGPLSRERNRFLARLVVKTTSPEATLQLLEGELATCRRALARDDRLLVDVEPQWM